jgi:hypothetical protein
MDVELEEEGEFVYFVVLDCCEGPEAIVAAPAPLGRCRTAKRLDNEVEKKEELVALALREGR